MRKQKVTMGADDDERRFSLYVCERARRQLARQIAAGQLVSRFTAEQQTCSGED